MSRSIVHITHDLLGQPQLTCSGGDGRNANGCVCIEVGAVKPNWCFLLPLTAVTSSPANQLERRCLVGFFSIPTTLLSTDYCECASEWLKVLRFES